MSSIADFRNYSEAIDRHARWWTSDTPSRPIVRIVYQTDPNQAPPPWDNWDITRRPDEPDQHVSDFIANAQAYTWDGDALPVFYPNFAPGITATMVHDFLEMGEETAWIEKPCSWDELDDIRFKEDHYWYQAARKIIQTSLDRGVATAVPDLSGVLDVAAAVRGTQTLMMDFFDNPERLQKLIADIRTLWFEWFDRFSRMIIDACGGMFNRWGFFGPGRHHPLQCDMAVMLSPKMYEQFVLPDLRATCDRLDWAIYHLDGEEQIAHLDMILSIPNLRLIQWVPGAGAEGTAHPKWFDMYRRIQSTGRGLVLGGNIDQIEMFCKEFNPKLMHLSVGVKNDQEAKRALDIIDKALA